MTSEPPSTPSDDSTGTPRPKRRRFLRLSDDGKWLTITQGRKVWLYSVERLDPHPLVGLKAWRLTKRAGSHSDALLPEIWAYDVLLTDQFGLSCDCRGFVRWGYCKHSKALAVLLAAGRLK